jgi:hypothetical protein
MAIKALEQKHDYNIEKEGKENGWCNGNSKWKWI